MHDQCITNAPSKHHDVHSVGKDVHSVGKDVHIPTSASQSSLGVGKDVRAGPTIFLTAAPTTRHVIYACMPLRCKCLIPEPNLNRDSKCLINASSMHHSVAGRAKHVWHISDINETFDACEAGAWPQRNIKQRIKARDRCKHQCITNASPNSSVDELVARSRTDRPPIYFQPAPENVQRPHQP